MSKSFAILVAALAGIGLGGLAVPALAVEEPPELTFEPEPHPDYVAAKDAIKAEKYPDAITLLEKVVKAEPNNADAFNLLGYSQRKLKLFDKAGDSYGKALTINADHKGALEYQGEMFLQMGDILKAEGNLTKLAKMCNSSCDEYQTLKKMVEAVKTGKAVIW